MKISTPIDPSVPTFTLMELMLDPAHFEQLRKPARAISYDLNICTRANPE